MSTEDTGRAARLTPRDGWRAWRRVAPAAVLVSVALGVTACAGGAASPGVASVGSSPTAPRSSSPTRPRSSNSSTSTTSARSSSGGPPSTASLLRFSECMRTHGVPDFPDPIASGSARPGRSTFLGNGPNPATSPAYQAASAACRKYAVASPVTPAGAARVEAEQLKYAQCMRAHGVPDFPDPSSNGLTIPSSVDESSPRFEAAEKACEALLPGANGPPGVGGS